MQVMDSLRSDISAIRIESRSKASRGWFFPRDALLSILTGARILEAISSREKIARPDERRLIGSLVLEKFPLVFSILLYDGNEDELLKFVHRQEYDTRLPLGESDLNFLAPSAARAFSERQWEFISPLFAKHNVHWELKISEILPFLHDEYLDHGSGGSVFSVKLCPGHQRLVAAEVEGQDLIIARKELKAGSSFQEKAMLEILRTMKHPNIVELLGSYTYKDAHNLLLPMADMSLHNLFQTESGFSSGEIFAGIFSLAEALSHIHDFKFADGEYQFSSIGVHHDVKPANILIKGRRFMWSDFGLSKFKPLDQTSRTRLKGGTEEYLSPEAFHEPTFVNGRVGRAYDVWAFGCVLAEIATYIENGKGSVDEFKEARKVTRTVDYMEITDHSFHLNGDLRPAAHDWLRRIAENAKEKQSSDLIALVREMLNPSWRTRMLAPKVAQRASRILLESKIRHLRELFLRSSSDGNTHGSSACTLLWLEGQRFKTWSDIYPNCFNDPTAANVHELLNTLTDLQSALERFMFEESSTQSNLHEVVCRACDALCEILPSHFQTCVNKLWLQKITELNDMEQLASIQTASKPQRYRMVGIKAAMKHICLAITVSRRVGGKSMLIEKSLISLDSGSQYLPTNDRASAPNEHRVQEVGGRVAGMLETKSRAVRVLVEWKTYDRRWTKKQGSEMFSRVEGLARFLNSAETPRPEIMKQRILNCLGYFHDDEKWRFGFVYAFPAPTPESPLQSKSFYSLNEFIRSSDYDNAAAANLSHPLLGDVFCLAQSLVRTVAALHEVSWLHKNISSHNVITFAPSKALLHQNLPASFLAGWDESRPEESTISFGPNEDRVHYQHPAYRRRNQGFRRTFDYFSLGVVLLELGLWVTVVELWKIHPECHFDADVFRKKLLDGYVPQLGERMGRLYRDAVTYCLNADMIHIADEDNVEYRREVQDAFQEFVIDKLSDCHA